MEWLVEHRKSQFVCQLMSQFVCQFISKIYCLRFCEIYYSAMKQNKYCALGNAHVAVRWAKAEVKPCQQCKASASFAHPTGPHGGRAQAASVFIAPHGRGKELEWRHTSSVKADNQITGGTTG